MSTPEHSAAHYQWTDGDLLLVCHLQPKASKSEFSGIHGDALKVRIQAPPVEGKANSELVKFLAKQFGVSKSAVSIISGELNRHKRVRITQPQRLPAEALITQS
ncbi:MULTISPECIES: DUF167 family protein [Thalassolituus]|uniref:UPF0235 protein NYR02_07850 n=1 Tax=Thalassolituus pacificus TaxID=2975440 RepID=A0A9X2WEI5_9GAMM|nr:YggU family protein [Thalassolituus sp. ST750PaO-4]MCT7358927.1 DUF167 family protein [Thalassolituus pacificus]PIQ39559.1 MAG: YggU family protein [Thalassolituus sp. CG17_big_fil_post_rev_8_21_14_2_50_53_8]